MLRTWHNRFIEYQRDILIVNGSQLLLRISIDPNICFGKPCVRGHRIWVSLMLDFLASGTTIPEILADYPQLQTEDILACIAYGAEMSRERFVDIAITPKTEDIESVV
jgi:uncharacterized protein (DUF433 family)